MRGKAPEVVDPGDTPCPSAGHHHLAGDGGCARGQATLEGDGEGGGLLGAQALGGPESEGQVLHPVLEGHGLQEDVLEGDGGAVISLDGGGALGLGGRARPKRGMLYSPPSREESCSVALASPSWQGSKVTSMLTSEPPGLAGDTPMVFVRKPAQLVCTGERRDHGGGGSQKQIQHLRKKQKVPTVTLSRVPVPCLSLRLSPPPLASEEWPSGMSKRAQQGQPCTQVLEDLKPQPWQ